MLVLLMELNWRKCTESKGLIKLDYLQVVTYCKRSADYNIAIYYTYTAVHAFYIVKHKAIEIL